MICPNCRTYVDFDSGFCPACRSWIEKSEPDGAQNQHQQGGQNALGGQNHHGGQNSLDPWKDQGNSGPVVADTGVNGFGGSGNGDKGTDGGKKNGKLIIGIVAGLLVLLIVVLGGFAASMLGLFESEEVVRVHSDDHFEMSTMVADMLLENLGQKKFDAIVVANSENYPDALSGAYLANQNSAPIILVSPDTVNDVKTYIRDNLKQGGTVYLLGGLTAVPEEMNFGLEEYRVIRFAGRNRFETNLLILKEATVFGEDIVVCNAWDYPDCLSAAALNKPILLVNETLTDEQRVFLRSQIGKKKIYVIGGTSAISNELLAELGEYGTTVRISGSTRYETSVNVAQKFFEAPESVVLVNGQTFAEGLCALTLAVSKNAPMILTDNANRDFAEDYVTSKAVEDSIIVASEDQLTSEAIRRIFGLSSVEDIVTRN